MLPPEYYMNAKWVASAKEGNIEDAIYCYVKERRLTTFAELQKRIGMFLNTYGDIYWEFDKNVIVWEGMSKEFMNSITILILGEKLFLRPGNIMTYCFDGTILKYPLVKKAPDSGYKHPHWLCSYLGIHPLKEARDKKNCDSRRGVAP